MLNAKKETIVGFSTVSHSLIWQTCNCFMKTGVYVYFLKDNSGLQRKKYLKIVPICFSSFFFFLLVWYKFAWYSVFLKKAIDIIKKIDTILDFVRNKKAPLI